MALRYGSYSKKGFRGSGMRLQRSEYYEYLFKNKTYCFKKKYYTSAYDGCSEYEEITQATFRRAMTQGKYTKVVSVEENISYTPLDVLIYILEDKYEVNRGDLRKAIFKAQEAIREYEKIYDEKIAVKTKIKIFNATIKFWLDYVIPKEDDEHVS